MSQGRYELNFFKGTGDAESPHCQATLVPLEDCGAKGKPRPCLESSYGVFKMKPDNESFAVCFPCYKALEAFSAEVQRRKGDESCPSTKAAPKSRLGST